MKDTAFDALPWDDLPVHKPRSLGTWRAGAFGSSQGHEDLRALSTELVRRIFEEAGRVDQALLVYCQEDPRGQLEGPQVYVIAAKSGPLTERVKQATAMLAQATAHFGRALAVVHMTEAWTYASTDDPRSDERIKAWKKAHGGSMEGMPGVEEAVIVTIETYRENRLLVARIHPDPLDPHKRRLGQFESTGAADKVVGRYANLLCKPEDKPA